MSKHELLIDPFKTIYAVNCKVEGTTLHCGAIYVEPRNPFQVIRLSDNSASLDLTLPEELIDQPTLRKGWDITLPIKQTHEQIQRSV
jgi:hypothetical protein